MAEETEDFDDPSEHDHDEADSAEFSDTEQSADDEMVATGFQVDDEPEPAAFDAETGEDVDSSTSSQEVGEAEEGAQSAEDIFAAEGDFAEETEAFDDSIPEQAFSETADEPAPGMTPGESNETSPAGYEMATGEYDTPADHMGGGQPVDFEESIEESEATSPEGYDEADLPDEAMATGQDEDTAAADEEYDPNASFAGADEAEEAGGEQADFEADDEQPEAEDEAEEVDEEEPLVLEAELSDIQNPPEPDPVEVDPLPEVGPYLQPATLTLHADGEQRETYALEAESLVLGRADQSDLPAPDIDLAAFASDAPIWQRHVAIYRQNKNYVLFVASDGATQLNEEMLELGDYRRLDDGDVVILGGAVGLQFELPEDQSTAAMGAAADESAEAEAQVDDAFEESGADAFEESDADAFEESDADAFQEGEFAGDMPADSDFDAGADTNAGQSDVPFE